MICKAVLQGKEAIEVATSESAVDTAVATAKASIDRVDEEIGDMGIQTDDELRLKILNLYQSWAISEFGQSYPFKGDEYFIYYGQHNGFYVLKFAG